MTNQRKAYLYGITAILFWSTMGSAFKLTLSYLSFVNLLLFTSLTSLLILSLVITFNKSWRKTLPSTRREWTGSALLGLLNPFGYYFILFKAYELIPAQEAVALNYTWPVVLVLLSIPFLKQKIGIKSILAILVSFTGAFLVVTKGNFSLLSLENPLGSMLALGSSLIWATFWLLNVRDKREETAKLFMNFLFGSLYSLVVVFLFYSPKIPNFKGVAGFLYIGIFEMGITFLLWLKALQYSLTTAKVTKLVYLSPFISLLLINRFVGESIHPYTIAGLGLIIGGIIWESLSNPLKTNQ
ncbi:MAG: DMT family transporter [Bacteroidetes bacterium]|nr:DMT family transporter [Bacteroidota bacterium]